MKLRQYQIDGVNRLIEITRTRNAALLADEPGLGKTIQVAEFINRTTPSSILIVCPASLRLNWDHELDVWMTPLFQHVEIVSYEQATKGQLRYPEYDLIVFDEAHYLKNPDAARTRVCLNKLKGKTRLFLTGTPVVNRPMDLYPILKCLGIKWTKTDFGKRYCGGFLKLISYHPKRYAWDFSGASNTEELGAVLRRHVMVRRTKAEVLGELPEKIRTVIELDIPSQESEKVQLAAKRYFDAISAAADNIAELENTLFEELASERHAEALRKLPHVVAYLQDLLLEEEKVVVFAHHRQVLEELQATLTQLRIPCVMLCGGLSDHAKDASVREFQEGCARVFLGQITAAGTGLTLTASHTVVFAEHDWVPGNLTQCEDRCHRFGQKNPVRVIHLVPSGSIEARMIRIVAEKQQVIDSIMN